MKCLFALFASLLLLATQTAFVSDGAEAPARQAIMVNCHCCCAKCKMRCCLTGNDAPVQNPGPATPARTVSQSDCQLVAVVELTLDRPAPVIGFSAVSDSLLSSMTAIPLYGRNCSYLL